MNADLLIGMMIFLTPFIVVVGYLLSRRDGYRKFGPEYMAIASSYQWKCLKALGPMALYVAISCYLKDWNKLLNGVSFSISACSFFTLALYEMACAVSLNHQVMISKERVQVCARLIIIGQLVSLVVAVLVFQCGSVYWPFVALQIVLLILAMAAFYLSGTVVNLVKIGYKPKEI